MELLVRTRYLLSILGVFLLSIFPAIAQEAQSDSDVGTARRPREMASPTNGKSAKSIEKQRKRAERATKKAAKEAKKQQQLLKAIAKKEKSIQKTERKIGKLETKLSKGQAKETLSPLDIADLKKKIDRLQIDMIADKERLATLRRRL